MCIFILFSKNHKDEGTEMEFVMVGGVPAGWENIERNIDLELEYFYKLDNTTTYNQIVEEIGKPDGMRGMGIILPYYKVGDLYVVIEFSTDENGKLDRVGHIFLCNSDERLENIYPK